MADTKDDKSTGSPGSQSPIGGDRSEASEQARKNAPAGIKDREADTSDSYGHTRESGESPQKS
jgi:hypothetical protein